MTRSNRGRNSSTNWLRKSTRFAIYLRDGFRCVYCAVELIVGTATLDHLDPRSHGGSDHPDNLVTACLHCNSIRRNRTLTKFCRHHVSGDPDRNARRIRVQAMQPLDRESGRQLARFARALREVA